MKSLTRAWAPLALGAALLAATLPAAAIDTLNFSEVVGPSLTVTTPAINSGEAGVSGEEFIVVKEIRNNSNASWHDYHIQIESLIDGVWQPSPESDGVSFDQAGKTPQEWADSTEVRVNNVTKTGYTASREAPPYDVADFQFLDFKVNPGDTLTLTFYMSDNADNTWRLAQRATIPEPGTLGLLGLAVAGLGALRRRKLAA